MGRGREISSPNCVLGFERDMIFYLRNNYLRENWNCQSSEPMTSWEIALFDSLSSRKFKLLNERHTHEWDISVMHQTMINHISARNDHQTMPQVGLPIFLTYPTIVSVGGKQKSRYSETELPIEVKRTVWFSTTVNITKLTLYAKCLAQLKWTF